MVFGMYFSNFMTYFWMLWCRKYIKVIWFLNCVVLKKEVRLQNGVSNLFRPRVFQSKENTGIDLLWQMVFIELSITKPLIILHWYSSSKKCISQNKFNPHLRFWNLKIHIISTFQNLTKMDVLNCGSFTKLLLMIKNLPKNPYSIN